MTDHNLFHSILCVPHERAASAVETGDLRFDKLVILDPVGANLWRSVWIT